MTQSKIKTLIILLLFTINPIFSMEQDFDHKNNQNNEEIEALLQQMNEMGISIGLKAYITIIGMQMREDSSIQIDDVGDIIDGIQINSEKFQSYMATYLVQPDDIVELLEDWNLLLTNKTCFNALQNKLASFPTPMLETLNIFVQESIKKLQSEQKNVPNEMILLGQLTHGSAEQSKSYFGQFARLTFNGKVTVGIGSAFAAIGIWKTYELLFGSKQEQNIEPDEMIYQQ